MNRQSLDDMIRKALEKVESEQRSADWDNFASKMEGDQPDELDSFVKDHLEMIQPTAPQAWNSFEDKYAEELGNEHPVDRTVKSNLAGHEAPYSESSWYRLSYLLDLTDRRERDLLIRKVSEILTVSLLLFILIPHFFIQKETRTSSPSPSAALYAFEHSLDKIAPLPPENWNVHSIEFSNSNFFFQSFSLFDPKEGNRSEARDLSKTYIASSESSLELRNQFLPARPVKVELSDPLQNLPAFFKPSMLNPLHLLQNTDDPKFGDEPHEMLALTDFKVESTLLAEEVDQLPLASLKELISTDASVSGIKLSSKAKRRNYRISAFHSPRLTHIFTPYDEVYDNESYGRTKVFQETGIELEKRNNHVTIGGAIAFGTMDYRPPVVIEAYAGNIAEVSSEEILGGYRSLSLSNINMSMLSASMFLRHFYPITQNLRWFTHFGGGINMVLTTDYLVQEIIDNSDGTFTENEFTFQEAESSAATEHVRLREKNFEGGILEGGNFNRNSFMDIQLGAGLEFDLNPRSTIFLTTVFNLSPFADGLGPNNDKINSLDLKLGCRYWL